VRAEGAQQLGGEVQARAVGVAEREPPLVLDDLERALLAERQRACVAQRGGAEPGDRLSEPDHRSMERSNATGACSITRPTRAYHRGEHRPVRAPRLGVQVRRWWSAGPPRGASTPPLSAREWPQASFPYP
jgi:hypothetical protein